ncbi:MAG: hypothetical protein HOV66_29585 [Streptomycetaceae bacterium]|nr:hypothetical protein [Streptomycetaceae bacterium]NUS58975.1 hypothetical protein [Streptomycetaceae bacterium]
MSNAERVRVVILDDEEDPGAHAIAPKATVGAPVSSRLADSATADLVPLAGTHRIIHHVITEGSPAGVAPRAVDH